MHSRDKMHVTATRRPDQDAAELEVGVDDMKLDGMNKSKRWVRVTLHNSKARPPYFYPKFEDIDRIVRAFCVCEDEKYPNGKGREMVRDFFNDVIDGVPYEQLAQKYNLPIYPSNTGRDNGPRPYDQ